VLIALGVAAIGGWVVGRQTLQPLTDMATQATAITERDPSARLNAPNSTDELATLPRRAGVLKVRTAKWLAPLGVIRSGLVEKQIVHLLSTFASPYAL
jgi:HAMP domain-containing protein